MNCSVGMTLSRYVFKIFFHTRQEEQLVHFFIPLLWKETRCLIFRCMRLRQINSSLALSSFISLQQRKNRICIHMAFQNHVREECEMRSVRIFGLFQGLEDTCSKD